MKKIFHNDILGHKKETAQMKKVMLIVMDGIGSAPKQRGNAVALASPRNLSLMWGTYPRTYLLAGSEAVGLPIGVKGNSEVGHLNLGAGRVINQNLPRINKNIEKGFFITNNTLWEALKHAIKYKSKIHLMGCLSDGGVHSHVDHFKATIDFFAQNNCQNEIIVHAFTDGRDSPPNSAKKYLGDLGMHLNNLGCGRFGTVVGRYLAMDRNFTWTRTKEAYDTLTSGIGSVYNTWEEAIDSAYKAGKTDEFIPPSIIGKPEQSIIKENDVVFFLNFRADRALQLTKCFEDPTFSLFPVKKFSNLFFMSMVEYQKGIPKKVVFPKEYINMPIGKVISEFGLRQLRLAESEKFPHVTYFFNGGLSVKYRGEDRIEVQSPRVSTYDEKPEMSAMEVLRIAHEKIKSDVYDFILVNLANGDMVGHTGNIDASIKAVNTVDYVVNDLVKRFIAFGGTVVITSDHGNVEEVINLKTGEIDTEHSINPVPFMIADPNLTAKMLRYGALKDVAPTILDIMQIPIPEEMTGRSLLSI